MREPGKILHPAVVADHQLPDLAPTLTIREGDRAEIEGNTGNAGGHHPGRGR
jgi:hypothetical protein